MNGTLTCDGRRSGNKTSNETWERWRDLILQSNVDLTKFGWVSEVIKVTGLTKRQIRNTVRKFKIKCFERK